MPFTSFWRLGESVTSTNVDAVRNFLQNETGEFQIRLTITDARGCKDSVSATVKVANTDPQAKFTFDKTEVCVGEAVNFKNESTNADFYCWDFGNGVVLNGDDQQFAFNRPGQYRVKLTAKNAGCTNEVEAENLVLVKDPFVDFEIVKRCDDPYEVNLINKSEMADLVSWDVGDGFTADSRDVSHRFAETGTYMVTLTGTNLNSQCVVTATRSVIIQDIEAGFGLTNETPCKNDPTQAIDQSKFAASWVWFVDNVLNSVSNVPVFYFQTAGNHEVRQVVRDSDGCSDAKSVIINVPNITGGFTFDASSTCEELAVEFNDTSVGVPPIDSWNWDFGDGKSSDLRNTSNVYQKLDSFDISLRLTNAEGQCTFLKRDAIVFTIPQLNFSSTKTNYCPNETVLFTNNTLYANEFTWSFGNAKNSSLFSPSTFYAQPGTYDITLQATDRYGCTMELTKQGFVIVTEPSADFQAFQTSAECPPLTSTFKSVSIGSNLTYYWTFGTGVTSTLRDPAYTYTQPGNYDVGLTVTDQFGCSHRKLTPNLIEVGGPTGSFVSNIKDMCISTNAGFAAEALNTLTYQWDFGDGNVVNHSEPLIEHTYSSPGVFRPTLVLIDNKNCHVVAAGAPIVNVHDSTAVEFTFSPECIFNGETLSFESTNQDNEIHEWLINGEKVAEGTESSLVLDSAGIYQLELRGTNEFGCISSHKQQVKIHGKIETIPNVFTPNGDSYNEFFKIPGVEWSDWTLQVFNRWGKKVFSQPSYQNGWQAKELAAGTYYYSLNNQTCPERSYKGYIHVLK